MPTHPSSDTGQDGPPTRTRMPEGHGGHGAAPRRTKPSRALVTVLGVVVVLVAVIVLANRGGGNTASDGASSGGTKGTNANPTAPTGDKPVTGNNAGIASGFAKSEQGAQSAAANYAVALGGDGMFSTDRRSQIVGAVYAPDVAAKNRADLDKVYSDPAFLQRIGLQTNGTASRGLTFVSRVNPVGTKTEKFDGDSATVAVWYSALFGLAGEGSTNPVSESWYTNTFQLRWVNADWKIVSFTQKDGPAPVGRDQAASSAKEMSDAVNGFGGFTYAR
ncbi:hypothetical protein [Streptomyces sp. RKAG293]|uniref:hypothetical protein n=1 Tax=Streptomyces sp. RKAG293 TaxID=2893403 RepID=UPI0020337495|nr:hypothetical protein [Streptomyces sp. RKAG293]MCM2420725.1 hypothetical protein [Streptomyces sp. RKAG293]